MKTACIVFVALFCSLWIGYSMILFFKLFILVLSEILKALPGGVNEN